jgi:hypothetical protein
MRSHFFLVWLSTGSLSDVLAFHGRTSSKKSETAAPFFDASGSPDDIARAVAKAGVTMRSWALANSTSYLQYLVASNLGGLGPEDTLGFPGLVYGNVAKLGSDQEQVTLVIVNTTEYVAVDITKNGMWHGLHPGINLLNGTTSFRGILLSCKTGMPVKVARLSLTFMDLDTNDDATGEMKVISRTHSKSIIGRNTSLNIMTLPDGSTSWGATIKKLKHTAPESPLRMTPAERSGSVALTWRDVTTFDFALQVVGVSDKAYNPPGRTFKFASVGEMAFEENLTAEDRERLMTVQAAKHGDNSMLIILAVAACAVLLAVCFCCYFS